MFTKIDLCSMALLKLGEKPIQSWREDSASAQLARTLFDPTVDTLLSLFPWRFATKTLVLNKTQDDDFLIPNEVLRILKCNGQIIGNKIKAAGLDVLNPEPMAKDSPLLQIQDSGKLIITPHLAWASTEARKRCLEEVKKNVEAFLRGEMRNIVNP